MAHAQKPDFVFRRNGRAHLNRRGASVQSTTGSRAVRVRGSNAGYTMFRGSVKGTGYSLHSPVSPFTSPPVRHRVPSHFNWTLTSGYPTATAIGAMTRHSAPGFSLLEASLWTGFIRTFMFHATDRGGLLAVVRECNRLAERTLSEMSLLIGRQDHRTYFTVWGFGSLQPAEPFEDVRTKDISGSNAGYTMFRGSMKGTGYPLHSPVSPSLPLPCVTVCHHISTGLYLQCPRRAGKFGNTSPRMRHLNRGYALPPDAFLTPAAPSHDAAGRYAN